MSLLSSYEITQWKPAIDAATQLGLVENLEKGQVIYLPKLTFDIQESVTHLLNPQLLANGAKNISYIPSSDRVKGFNEIQVDPLLLKNLMRAFSTASNELILALFPRYKKDLRLGRTSFRPAEIAGRQTSYRKNDMLLHVDAFPSMPVRGQRILRVFCNINPNHQPRQWHLGESFQQVIERFAAKVRSPLPGAHALMKLCKVTKGKRSLYDHYMLKIHHTMKKDKAYQKKAIQEKVAFPANSTWIVFTDLVSHAALAGQHLLEQTFYLPPEAQFHPEWSPIKRLENYLRRSLLLRACA